MVDVQELLKIHRANTEGYIRKDVRTGKIIICLPKRRGFDGALRSSMSNRLREIQLLGR